MTLLDFGAICFVVLVVLYVGSIAAFFWHARQQTDDHLSHSSSDADCAIPTIQPPHADWN